MDDGETSEPIFIDRIKIKCGLIIIYNPSTKPGHPDYLVIKLDQNLCLISTNIGCSILENMQLIKMDNEHEIDLDQDNDNVHFEYKSLSMSMHLAR